MSKKITSLLEATDLFLNDYCRTGGQVVNSVKEKGTIAYVVQFRGMRYYVTYKTQWYHTFYTINQNTRQYDDGQGFNMSIVDQAAANGAIVVLVMPAGDVYFKEAQSMYDWIETHDSYYKEKTLGRASKGFNEKKVGCVPREWLELMTPESFVKATA